MACLLQWSAACCRSLPSHVCGNRTVRFAAFVETLLSLWLQIPRFAFEKFPGSKAELTTQMKSVGEAMAIGRTFQARCCNATIPSAMPSPG